MALNFLNNGYFAGKVGIGIQSPTVPLDVSGVIKTTTSFVGNAVIINQVTAATSSGRILFKNNSGSDKMAMEDNGNFGIGTVSPSRKLSVYQSSSSLVADFRSASGNNSYISLSNNASTADQVRIGSVSSSLVLSTNYTERVRIDSSGNVGIGTTSPTTKLNVSGNIAVSSGSYLSFIDSNLDYNKIGRNTSVGGIQITTGGNATMNLLDNGNVGIGTTAPSDKLDIAGAARFTSNISFDSGKAGRIYKASNHGLAIQGVTGTENDFAMFTPTGALKIVVPTGTNNLILNRDNGNVGIGTTSPSQKLTVEGNIELGTGGYIYGDTTTSYLRLNNAAGSLLGYSNAYIGLGPSFVYNVGGSEKFRIASSTGNVGIGITNPAVPLDVEGKIRSNDSNSGDYLEIFCDGSVSGDSYIENTNNNIQIKSAFATSFSTSGSVAMFIKNNQNVGIGTTSPLAKLQVGLSTSNAGSTLAMFGAAVGGILSGLSLVNTLGNAVTGQGVALDFHVNSAYSPTGRIATVSESTNTPAALAFYTYNGGLIEKMRITSAGGISFGNSTTAYGTSGQILKSNGNASPTWIDGSAIPGVPGGSGTVNTIPLWTPDGDTLGNSIITQPTSAEVRVAGALKVNSTVTGYGSTKIQTGGFGDSQSGINILNSTTGYGYILFGDGSGADLYRGQITYKHGDDFMAFNTAGSERMRIFANGTILIGSTIDFSNGNADDLQIGNTTGSHGVSIMSQNNAVGSIYFGDNDNNDAGIINYEHGLNQLRFVTNRAQRMVIDSTGNVGIGTSSPGTKLQVGTGSGATVDTAYQIVADGSAISGIQILSGATQSGRLVFGDSGNNDIGIIKYDHSNNSLQTIVNAAERMRIDASGNVGIGVTSIPSWANLITSGTVAVGGRLYIKSNNSIQGLSGFPGSSDKLIINPDGGNVGVGTTSPTAKLHVAGTGLFTGLVSGITPVNAANFVTKAYVDGSGGGTGPFLPLAGGTLTGNVVVDGAQIFIDTDTAGNSLTWRESDSSIVAGQLRGYGNRGDIYLYDSGVKKTELSSQADSFIPALHIGGTSAATGGVLQVTGNATFAGDVIVSGGDLTINSTGNAILNVNGTANSFVEKDTGTDLYFANNVSDKDIIFRVKDDTTNVIALTIDGSEGGDSTFAAQAFSAATSSGDASSTLTTKGYVDSLITGATIYRGAWQAGISATSSAATTASTTLTVTAAILDADGNTPVLVGAVVTGEGITGIVKVASVTSSTVYVLDTAITATATAYIFSPIYGAPDLSGVTETSGYYYICSEAGSATPNGANSEPNTWAVGDWCIYNDVSGTGQWQKIDNSSVLSGVGTGQTVALWEGAGSVTDSETLGNAPITVNGNDSTFAGNVIAEGSLITRSVNANVTISGDTSGNIYYNNASGEHRWRANGSSVNSMNLSSTLLTVNENATFTSNVYVGSATTNGGVINLIQSTTNPEIRIQSGESGATAFSIYNTATNPDAEQFFINNNLSSSHLGNARGALKLEDSSGTALTLSSGNATFAGDVIIDDGVGRLTLESVSGANRILSTTTGFGTYELLELRAEAYEFKIGTTDKFSINSSGNATFAGTVTATTFLGNSTTQTAGNNSTKIATTAYADAAAAAVPIGNYLPLSAGSSYPLTGNLIVENSVKADAFFSHQGTYTANSYVNDWQKVYSHNWSTFSFSAFTIKVLAGGNTSNNNLNADVHISYKMQNGQYRVYANIVNYGAEALLAENFKINLSITSAASGSWTIWHKLITNYQTPYYTLIGSGIEGTWYSETPVASPTGDDDTWNERIILNSMSVDVDNSANVGIGTTAPTSLLEISKQLSAASTIDYPYTISSRDDANSINQAGGEGVGIKFRIAGNAATTPGDSLVGASIAAIRESASDTDSSTGLGLFVTQNDETLDEALRIDHDGNVGIGTTSPSQKLQVAGNIYTTGSIRIEDTGDQLEFGNANVAMQRTSNLLELGGYDGIVFKSSNTVLDSQAERMRITSAGNVGIGTTSPSYKLTVSGGGIQAGGKITYTKSAGSLDTTGYAVAGLTTSSNGQSAGFTFTCFGHTGGYQKIVYSCYNGNGTWVTKKVINEGTNQLDVVASANGTTITFTFKSISGTMSYTPRVTIEAVGTAINSTYA